MFFLIILLFNKKIVFFLLINGKNTIFGASLKFAKKGFLCSKNIILQARVHFRDVYVKGGGRRFVWVPQG